MPSPPAASASGQPDDGAAAQLGSQAGRAHAVVVGVLVTEALLVAGVAVWLALSTVQQGADEEGIAVGALVFFVMAAALLGALAVAARRRWGPAHGMAVTLQLLALPMVWQMTQQGFWVGAVPIGALAVAGLVALLSPDGRAAFGRG